MPITGKGPMMLGILWTFQSVAFALVGLRLYARCTVVQTYGWDDHFFGISVILLLVYNVLLTAAAPHGLGTQSSATLLLPDQSTAVLYVNIAQSVLNLASITVKLSIATFLYRLVSTNRAQRRAVVVPAALLTAVLVASMLVLWLSCTPLRYGWDLSVRWGYCNVTMQFVAVMLGGFAIVLVEIYYSSFAWYLIRGLQIPRSEMIVIGVCMSIGYISAVCSIWRVAILLNMAFYTDTNESYLYAFVDILVWNAADITTQLLCITVTVCRPLYKDWLNALIARVRNPSQFTLDEGTPQGPKSGAGSDFSVIALQTIGGSSVPSSSKAGGRARGKGSTAGAVTIERSWLVESNSRSMLFPDDGHSEEPILGGTGGAERDSDVERL